LDLVDTLEKDKDLDLSQSGWGFVKKIKKKIAAKKKKRAAAGPKPCRFFCIMVKKARAAGVNKLLTQFVEPYLGEIAEKVGDKASCHVLEPIIADAIDKKSPEWENHMDEIRMGIGEDIVQLLVRETGM